MARFCSLWFEVTCHRGCRRPTLSKLRPLKAATSRAQSKEGFAFEPFEPKKSRNVKILAHLTPLPERDISLAAVPQRSAGRSTSPAQAEASVRESREASREDVSAWECLEEVSVREFREAGLEQAHS